MIIIDYLQLVSVRGSRGNRTEEVGQISRGLKILARELDVPIIALSQLSRQAEKTNESNEPTDRFCLICVNLVVLSKMRTLLCFYIVQIKEQMIQQKNTRVQELNSLLQKIVRELPIV
jgi:replicative DNA helicase